jgi:hypothetical protein
MSNHRLMRDPDRFTRDWAARVGADESTRQQLLEKIELTVVWYRLLSRAVVVTQNLGTTGDAYEKAAGQFAQSTNELIRRYGSLVLRIGTESIVTEEGFELPWKTDAGSDVHMLFPLVRDGVNGFSLLPGVQTETLTGLISLIASEGRRTGHNALTWLWTYRDPSLQLVLGSWLSARAAYSLATQPGSAGAYRAYVKVLESVGPGVGASSSGALTVENMTDFEDPSFDPVRAQRLVTHGRASGELVVPSSRTRVGFTIAMGDPESARFRRQTIRRLQQN